MTSTTDPDKVSTMHVSTVSLPASAPFDFAASLRFLRLFPATKGEQVVTEDTLTKAVREAGASVAVAVSQSGPASVRCALHSATGLTDTVRDAVADRIGFFLGLDDDLTEFYQLAAGDPGFDVVARRLRGYHQVKFASPRENVCWAILAQRNPMPVAQRMKRALMDAFGNTVSLAGVDYTAFPDLDQLATLGVAELTGLIGNPRKAGYLAAAVEALRSVDETFLRHGPLPDVRQFLLDIPGIGPWSAAFVLIRSLGRTEEIPADKALLTAAAKVYGQPLSDAEFLARARRYGAWKGYWGHYLRVAA